jgi:hypothetical protein
MASAYTKSLIKTFATQYGSDIIDAITNTGLFFPAIIAQLSVESSNGTSKLATQYNNFGGVKGDASNGVLLSTTEGDSKSSSSAYFRKFESFKDYLSYYIPLLTSKRYADGLTASSPEEQVTAWVNDGYSTMSAAGYLANGIQDRINATRDLFPGLSRISTEPVQQPYDFSFQTSPSLTSNDSTDGEIDTTS